jgi:P-type Ca2+ transporter type 2C
VCATRQQKRAHAEQSGRDPLILNPTTRKQLKEVVDIRKEIINVRFGSEADMCGAKRHVRFAPKSGQFSTGLSRRKLKWPSRSASRGLIIAKPCPLYLRKRKSGHSGDDGVERGTASRAIPKHDSAIASNFGILRFMTNGTPLPIFGSGLSEVEAQNRLQSEGYNELPRQDRRTPLRIVLEVFREPMFALLLGGGFIYLLLGDLKEALILLGFAIMSVAITVIQETRTERVLEALRDLTSPRALVIRDGVRRRIAGREVARGDLVVLAEGDRVPADAVLVQAHDVQADESLLTGESVPVRKIAAVSIPASSARPGGDDLPFVYSGALVVRGSGLAHVIGTGPRSEIGKIGQSLHALETEPPRLQLQTARLVRLSAFGGAAVSVGAVVLYGTLRGGWLDAVLTGITIGMSMLPEEFPVVLTVFMAMGAWRISKARVLTRRAASIETLGSATVLCTDKTGTLTENRMSIVELRLPDDDIFRPREATNAAVPDNFRELAAYGLLASTPEPFDPMEKAFHEFARDELEVADGLPGSDWKLAHSYGLRPELLAMSQLWQKDEGRSDFVVAAKGAPEIIADLCHLGPAELQAVRRSVDSMATEGLRVLGVAKAMHEGAQWPESQRDFPFVFLGLVGLADPLRSSVPAAVRECGSAGIRVVMITGDYPATARAIAQRAGLDASAALTGDEIEHLDDSELARSARTVGIFARIMPEQKLRIVQALKADGEIVAMTGDGVNDAPSLKAAHIGVAMGGRGTDVAREASSIVLLDDDFGSIVTAIRLGRRIYDNVRKAMGFIFAVHVPIAGLALLPLVFGLPIIFGPIHIAFLEMVIDPVCSLVFEAETDEEDVMRRKPRIPDAPLFSWPLIGWSVFQGGLTFGLVGAIFLIALYRGMPEDEARALTFFSLVLSIVSLILVNRSYSTSLVAAFRRPNPALAWILLTVTVILGLSLLWPTASALFRFGPLHADDLAVTIAAGIVVLIVLETLKHLWRMRLGL